MRNSPYTNAQLEHIVDQAMIYQCACPAQVASMMMALRELHAYEQKCLSRDDAPLVETHRLISTAAEAAHAIMETCLQKVIAIEGWDAATLNMPEALRALQRAEMARWRESDES